MVYLRASWLRANQGGVLLSDVKLGANVKVGDVLGTVTDPITNNSSNIVAPENGRVLGMALNQMVMPGFAAFHLGIPNRNKNSELATDSTAEAAAQEAIEPVREAAAAAAREAAESAALTTNDPETVTAAAREAAREVVEESTNEGAQRKKSDGSESPAGDPSADSDVPPAERPRPFTPHQEPDEHPE
jgi:hypothetical protein